MLLIAEPISRKFVREIFVNYSIEYIVVVKVPQINHSFPQNNPYFMKAIWNNTVLAESNNTVVVEGNHYFPKEAINREFFQDSTTHTTCPWKGLASYYSLNVEGQQNKDAAWYYPDPKAAAAEIKDHVAFWKGVQIVA